jgi:hypothetical protein
MDERADMDKSNEVLLPGFRFYPTDEELVSFYLKRKIQQKPLSIELIRQLDIYKYDPWDLPSKPLYLFLVNDQLRFCKETSLNDKWLQKKNLYLCQ